MKARFVKTIGLPGRVASVTSIGIRVRRTASTNTPPCSRTFAMWRSDEVRASVPARLSWKLFMADPGQCMMHNGLVSRPCCAAWDRMPQDEDDDLSFLRALADDLILDVAERDLARVARAIVDV